MYAPIYCEATKYLNSTYNVHFSVHYIFANNFWLILKIIYNEHFFLPDDVHFWEGIVPMVEEIKHEH